MEFSDVLSESAVLATLEPKGAPKEKALLHQAATSENSGAVIFGRDADMRDLGGLLAYKGRPKPVEPASAPSAPKEAPKPAQEAPKPSEPPKTGK